MKADRKHELQHNELEDFLAKAAAFFRENGVFLGIGAAVVVVAVITYYSLLAERSLSAPAGKWKDYFYALADVNADGELEKLIDDHKGSKEPAILWAKLSLGEMKLAEASRELFEDRDAAAQSLESAETYLLDAEKNAGRLALLRDRARIGLAKVYESQNKPDEAIKYYDMVVKSSPDTAQGKVALRGKQRLSEESNREFLDWFAHQKPVKKPSSFDSQFDPSRPPSETPDFSLPPLESPITPGLKLPGDEKTPSDTTPPPTPKSEKTELPDDGAKPDGDPAAKPKGTPSSEQDQDEAPPADNAKPSDDAKSEKPE